MRASDYAAILTMAVTIAGTVWMHREISRNGVYVMGDFTRAGDVGAGLAFPHVGDIYRDKDMLRRPAGGMVSVVDTLPVETTPPTAVVIEDEHGARHRLTLEQFRARYVFRRAAK